MSILGRTVTVTVDRPMGSRHPHFPDTRYPVNYGYIEGIMGGDGEPQDAYILGLSSPADRFEGVVVAIIHRLDDNEDKWVVAPEGYVTTQEKIREALSFQEQYFLSEIRM